jgi:hypothetical protein
MEEVNIELNNGTCYDAILHDTDVIIKNLSKERSPTLRDMEELLKLVQIVDEKCHAAEEKTNDQERDHLETKLLVIWKKLGSVMHPVMEIDDELLPVYNELSEISKELDILDRREGEAMNEYQREFALIVLQDRLHKVEETSVSGVFLSEGVTSLVNVTIPSGQSICASLLAHCYRIVYNIQCHDIKSFGKQREVGIRPVEELNQSLAALLMSLKVGLKNDPRYFETLMGEAERYEDLKSAMGNYGMDGVLSGNNKKLDVLDQDENGRFVEFESLGSDLNLTHALINDCILAYSEPIKRSSNLVSQKEIGESREKLLDHLEACGGKHNTDFLKALFEI